MAIDFSNPEFDPEELSEPLVTTSLTREDEGEYSLRPKTLREYIGQEKAKGNLEVFIQAAKMRNEPLDHVLLQLNVCGNSAPVGDAGCDFSLNQA